LARPKTKTGKKGGPGKKRGNLGLKNEGNTTGGEEALTKKDVGLGVLPGWCTGEKPPPRGPTKETRAKGAQKESGKRGKKGGELAPPALKKRESLLSVVPWGGEARPRGKAGWGEKKSK